MNIAYVEPSDSTPQEVKELMAKRKIKLNDKLKAVLLIKTIGVDDSMRRDILAKVDFNLEPKKVYEATKTAIRDICGETEKAHASKPGSDQVLLTKPW